MKKMNGIIGYRLGLRKDQQIVSGFLKLTENGVTGPPQANVTDR